MERHSAGSLKQSAVTRVVAVVCLLAAMVLPLTAGALEQQVPPGVGTLQAAIDAAQAGTTLVLGPGTYSGKISIDKTLSLLGEKASIVKGDGEGRVITVNAPDVVVSTVTVMNSGTSLATEDSGIFVTAEAVNARIEFNHIEQNLIGIYLKGANNAWVRGNTIYGSLNPRMNERGNGIHIWNATDALIEDNKLYHGRDGIFVTTSRKNTYRNNRFEDMRFAVHYMYTNNSEVSGNLSIGNHSAYALMFSDRLKVFENISVDSRDRGVFLNFVNYSGFRYNTVSGGTEKCVFIYNANGNWIEGNHFEGCDIGIHFTAGSEKNTITENTFTGNRTQVKYVGTRHIEWSLHGKGNFWSDNTSFDLDNDGIADRPYHPNDMVDQIVWRYPLAKLLLNSPATQLLRWAQSEFPSLHPGGVTDSAPLMNMPTVALNENDE